MLTIDELLLLGKERYGDNFEEIIGFFCRSIAGIEDTDEIVSIIDSLTYL